MEEGIAHGGMYRMHESCSHTFSTIRKESADAAAEFRSTFQISSPSLTLYACRICVWNTALYGDSLPRTCCTCTGIYCIFDPQIYALVRCLCFRLVLSIDIRIAPYRAVQLHYIPTISPFASQCHTCGRYSMFR